MASSLPLLPPPSFPPTLPPSPLTSAQSYFHEWRGRSRGMGDVSACGSGERGMWGHCCCCFARNLVRRLVPFARFDHRHRDSSLSLRPGASVITSNTAAAAGCWWCWCWGNLTRGCFYGAPRWRGRCCVLVLLCLFSLSHVYNVPSMFSRCVRVRVCVLYFMFMLTDYDWVMKRLINTAHPTLVGCAVFIKRRGSRSSQFFLFYNLQILLLFC